MRIFESLLKVLFLIGGIYLIWSRNLGSHWLYSFLIINLLLGVILLLNDHAPSYKYPKNYKHNGRVLAMRKLEGAIMILFSIFMLSMFNA